MRWIVVLVAILLIFFATALLVALVPGRGPVLRPGSVLVLEIEGDLPEQDLRSPLEAALEDEIVRLHDLTFSLQSAATDRRVEAALLICRSTEAGWGKLQELRDAVSGFRDSGKPVFALLEFAGSREYYLASAASELFMVPTGALEVSGLMSDVPFYRGTLEKIGVQAELERIGPYKSAAETYTHESMSDAHREALNAILDGLSGELTEAVALARGLSTAEVERLVDRGLFTAQGAVEAGLIDGALYGDELVERIEEEVGESFPRVGPGRYRKRAERQGGPRIAVVYAGGLIVPGESGEAAFGGGLIGSDSMVRILEEIREDRRIRAVVLRVDSPGGSGMASDLIWRATQELRGEKPLIASLSDVAASGGYYIAMGSDAIVAQPATLTGSIGVISGKFNFRGFYDWIGLKREQIKRGRNAGLFSDYTPFTDEQRGLIRGHMESFYGTFLAKAAEGRGRSAGEIDGVGQGRVWTGRQALERGLVDALGGLDRAVEMAREKAGLPPGRRVRLVVYPRRETLWNLFTGDGPDTRGPAGLLPGGSRPAVLARIPATREMARLAARFEAACRLAGEPALAWEPDL